MVCLCEITEKTGFEEEHDGEEEVEEKEVRRNGQ